MSQVGDRSSSIAPVLPADLDYLITNGYVLRTSQDDYNKGVSEVARLTQLITQVNAENAQRQQAATALQSDEKKEHSITFHFEGREEKEALEGRVQSETALLTRTEAELTTMESNVNGLIQEKSMIDRMVAYDGGYLSLTGLGTVILSDLTVRSYRVSDLDFSDFLSEIRATYSELRSIADRATSYVTFIMPRAPALQVEAELGSENVSMTRGVTPAPSVLWGSAIGLAKLRGDPSQIGERFAEALGELGGNDITATNMPTKLMAAEVITALGGQDVRGLVGVLKGLEKELQHQSVPKGVSTGVAAAIMAGRRFDGTYPTDRFAQVKRLTSSNEAASILAVMNVQFDALSSRFQNFRDLFTAWGYMKSEDTEIASAFLAIGELGKDEVMAKLSYIVDQLHNYLQYPLVAAAILASIPVFEAHEVLDLMEKAVTLLNNYAVGLERSEVVALAVRMIHGVRNELVRKIDSTATITQTPVQFTYPVHPGLFIWYHPIIIAHSFHYAPFGAMGAFHPAHPHGVGGFAG